MKVTVERTATPPRREMSEKTLSSEKRRLSAERTASADNWKPSERTWRGPISDPLHGTARVREGTTKTSRVREPNADLAGLEAGAGGPSSER